MIDKTNNTPWTIDNIHLEVTYWLNQKEWELTSFSFAKAKQGKEIETVFSQLCNQFMLIRDYAKQTEKLLLRIIAKN
jgi:hypothetical protein